MEKCKKTKKNIYFTPMELAICITSVVLIVGAFLIFDRTNYLSLIASVVGVFSLILCARGNPIGQGIMLLFCLLYALISYKMSYFGEMITYLGMSAPMAILSLVSWIKNPYKKKEVRVNRVGRREILIALALSFLVTVLFYFILRALGTASLITSTFSVTTSFLAAYFTFRRSKLYALFYVANDVVLIILWCIATYRDTSYICVVVCFLAFLLLDLYSYICWRKMEIRQSEGK